MKNKIDFLFDKIDKLANEQEFQKAIITLKEFMEDNFLTMKEEKEFKNRLSYLKICLERQKDSHYFSSLSKEKFHKLMLKENALQKQILNLFLDKYSKKITSADIMMFQILFSNPFIENIHKLTLIYTLLEYDINHDWKIFNNVLNQEVHIKKNQFPSLKNSRYYTKVEDLFKTGLSKQPSIENLCKQTLLKVLVSHLGVPPKQYDANQLSEKIINYVWAILNSSPNKDYNFVAFINLIENNKKGFN